MSCFLCHGRVSWSFFHPFSPSILNSLQPTFHQDIQLHCVVSKSLGKNEIWCFFLAYNSCFFTIQCCSMVYDYHMEPFCMIRTFFSCVVLAQRYANECIDIVMLWNEKKLLNDLHHFSWRRMLRWMTNLSWELEHIFMRGLQARVRSTHCIVCVRFQKMNWWLKTTTDRSSLLLSNSILLTWAVIHEVSVYVVKYKCQSLVHAYIYSEAIVARWKMTFFGEFIGR